MAVSAIFAGLLTKVGVYALVRTFTLIFTTDVGYTHTALLVVAGLTMLTGVLCGGAERDQAHPVVPHHQPDRLHGSWGWRSIRRWA